MQDAERRATAQDIHDTAAAMPHVTVDEGPLGNAAYQVGGKSFVFFRNPRPDAVDPSTGERAEPNLPAAAQMIDIIAMLQDKTKGNLLEPEAKLLDDLLYELRLRFLEAQQGGKRIITP